MADALSIPLTDSQWENLHEVAEMSGQTPEAVSSVLLALFALKNPEHVERRHASSADSQRNQRKARDAALLARIDQWSNEDWEEVFLHRPELATRLQVVLADHVAAANHTRSVGRVGDMSPLASMRVSFDAENDVCVSVCDEHGMATVEFCCSGSGGGKSPRTRDALIALMAAIAADNERMPARNANKERSAPGDDNGYITIPAFLRRGSD